MAGIHRERPGAIDLAAATDTPAQPLGDGVWMSPGVSNSYAVATDEGRVIVNGGLVFEGPLHRKAFADGPGPTRAIVVTPGARRPLGRGELAAGRGHLGYPSGDAPQLPVLARRQHVAHEPHGRRPHLRAGVDAGR